ncbi:hypothetical protein [Oceanobacillus sp. J11TS1]|uniref:hypothetical protein n=1 Tax=Oceanobacillus sp. J11TS1 TaxID=2807191 RepID=UPI001B230208|nr:hypothetical protein [Oceanobacillus sp. J11TS1]GIO22185.1 hypothetical protein J11TS1_07660 [Oceanobacillus sp. J11TS1]
MNEEIVRLYSNFDKDNLSVFFEKLIGFINKHDDMFREFIFENTLEVVKTFKAKDFFLGTSDENLEGSIHLYAGRLKNASNKDICENVIHLLWDIAAYMTKEICLSCQDRLSKDLILYQSNNYLQDL